MLFPPPMVIVLGASMKAWTSYVTPAATWDAASLPVHLAVVSSPALPGIGAEGLDASLVVAARQWMIPSCTAVSFVVDAAHPPLGDPSSLVADGKNEVIVHTTDWPTALEPGAIAHTVVYLVGDRIVEADIHLDAKDWTFALDGASTGGTARDLRSVLTHELGHVLGIGHSTEPRATMDAGLPAGSAGRTLEADDLAAACALYPPDPKAPAAAHGCDRDGLACPTGFICVGHACERAGEDGVLGAACAKASPRCDGASDDAYCLPTSHGERCVAPCPPTGCGAGLACLATDTEGHHACIPEGSSIPLPGDAGDGGVLDAGGDGGLPVAPASSGGCVFTARDRCDRRLPALSLGAIVLFIFLRRTRRGAKSGTLAAI